MSNKGLVDADICRIARCGIDGGGCTCNGTAFATTGRPLGCTLPSDCSASAPSQLPPPPPNDTTGYWQFNESSGSSAGDSSGNSMTANLIGSPTFQTGKSGNALSLSGSGQYANIGTPAPLQITGSMTISAWINLSSMPLHPLVVIAKSDASPQLSWYLFGCSECAPTGWQFGIHQTGSDVGSARRSDITLPLPGVWTHVTGVYDASARTLDVYVNGVLHNGTGIGVPPPTSQYSGTSNTLIGAWPYNISNSYFPGLIDDLRVYSRALSSAEILSLYNSY